MAKTLTEEQLEALDYLLGYIFESEEEDYIQRMEEGDDVKGHVFEHATILNKVFD